MKSGLGVDSLLQDAEVFVKQAVAQCDGSHDWSHIARVRANALRLAKDEGLSDDQTRLVELCAVLHDVGDW